MSDNAIQPAGFVTTPAAKAQINDTPLPVPAGRVPAGRVPTGQRGLIDLLRRNFGSAEPPQ
jgi:hypothetical protein